MRTSRWLVLLCLFGSTTLVAQGTFAIRRGSVGPVSIGMSGQEITRTFPADRRRSVDLRLEGYPTPALELTLAGSKARGGVVVELQGDKVFRIWITDPAARTEKGIGVGSTVAQLRDAYRVAWVSQAEGCLCMRVEELGATFDVDQSGPSWRPSGLIHDPAEVPGTVKVIRILLVLPVSAETRRTQHSAAR
jgi:hypothetical protein